MDKSRGIRIFISYRRDDSAFQTTAIHARLVEAFGADGVFMDVDNIPAGRDFRQHLQLAIQKCDACVAVIGDSWLSSVSPTGTKRIDDERDFVRVEIESALARDIPVIPLLVGKATMPSPAELPASMAELCYRQALTVRPGRDFRNDMQLLLAHLTAIPRISTPEAEPPRPVTGEPSRAPAAAPLTARTLGEFVGLAWRWAEKLSFGSGLLLLLLAYYAVSAAKVMHDKSRGFTSELGWDDWALAGRCVLYTFIAGWCLQRLRRIAEHIVPRAGGVSREILALVATVVCTEMAVGGLYYRLLTLQYLRLMVSLIGAGLVVVACFGLTAARRRRQSATSNIFWCLVTWAVGAWILAHLDAAIAEQADAMASADKLDIPGKMLDVLRAAVQLGGALWIAKNIPEVAAAADSPLDVGTRWRWSAARCLPFLLLWYVSLTWQLMADGDSLETALTSGVPGFVVNFLMIGAGLFLLGMGSNAALEGLRSMRRTVAPGGAWRTQRMACGFVVLTMYLLVEVVLHIADPAPDALVGRWLIAFMLGVPPAFVAAMVGLSVLRWLQMTASHGMERRSNALGAVAAGAACLTFRTFYYSPQASISLAAHLGAVSWALVAFWSLGMLPCTPSVFIMASPPVRGGASGASRIRMTCPGCSASLLSSASNYNKTLRCPKCKTLIEITGSKQ